MKKPIIAAVLLSFLLTTACGRADGTESSSDTPVSAETTISEEETTAETTTEPVTEETEAAETTETTEKTEENTTEAVTETTAAGSDDTTEAPAAEPEEEPAEVNGAPNDDFVSIAGDWYIDGDPTLASIHIEPDGTFKTYYAAGYLENEGTIRREPEEIGGTTVWWYYLYDKNNEIIMGFVDDGSSVKNDIYIGNGAYPHYQKFGVGGLADDGRGPGEEFVGTWGCGRATLTITQLSDTEFHALIWWSDSAAAHVEWDYPLTYQDGKLVCSGSCTKTYIEYSSPDTDPDKTVEYTNGSGEFIIQGAGIFWNDLTEHRGDDMVFSNTLPE
ncbi:MAG: hypothetical protein IJ555_14205 [Ruminococcus sp.]|nr:hypothetical protein [Ruminococcus sp.]MBR2284630.1 hypothetical protein [Ruminococcus sp.]